MPGTVVTCVHLIHLQHYPKSFLVLSSMIYTAGTGYKEREPETTKSRRKIMFPQFVIEALKQHRVRQLEARLKAGKAWTEKDLVFCDKQGGYIFPNTLSYQFSSLLQAAGLPTIRFHDLRHSAATDPPEYGGPYSGGAGAAGS